MLLTRRASSIIGFVTERPIVKVTKKMNRQERENLIAELTAQMKEAARLLEFEHAAFLRDKIKELRGED